MEDARTGLAMVQGDDLLDQIINSARGAATSPGGPPSEAAPGAAPGSGTGGFITETLNPPEPGFPGATFSRPALPGEVATPVEPVPSGAQGEAPPETTATGVAPTSLDDVIQAGSQPGEAPTGEEAPIKHPEEDHSFIADYATGAANRIAERTGQVVDAVSLQGPILNAVKTVGTWLIDHPDDFEKNIDGLKASGLIDKLLKKAGLPPTADTFPGELGGETVDSLLVLAALRAAAPAMMNLKGANMGSRFLQRYGEALVKHPYLAVVSDVFGATPGAVAGRRITGSPFGAIAGSIIGGPLAMVGAKGVQALGKMAMYPFRKPPTGAVVPTGLTEVPHDFARLQVEGDLQHIEDSIERAINGIRRPAETSSRLQRSVYEGLQEAEKTAEGVERQYWNRVKVLGNGVNPDDVMPNVEQMIKNQTGRYAEAEIPTQAYDRVKKLFKGWDDPESKTVAVPNIQRVRAEMRQLRREIKEEWGKAVNGGAPNETLIKHKGELISMLNDAVRNAAPGDVPLRQAIAMSTEVGNYFSRGIIPRLLGQTRNGTAAVRPEFVMDELLNQRGGIEDITKMSRAMRTGAPWRTTMGDRSTPPIIGPTGTNTLRQLEADMRNTLRAKVHEAIDASRTNGEIDAKTAQRLIRAAAKEYEPMSKVAAKLQDNVDRLGTILDRQKELRNSALAKYAKVEDPDKAISSLINRPDSMRDLFNAVRGNHLAVEGLQDGIIRQMVTRNTTQGKLDPVKFNRYIHTPEARRTLQAGGFTGDQIARLDRMVDTAAKLATGDIKLVRTKLMSPLLMVGGIFGSTLARKVVNTGTLQAPAYLAKAFRGLITRSLAQTDPGALLSLAMRDAQFEKSLLRPEPKYYTKLVSKLVRRMEGLREAADAKFHQDAQKTPDERGDGASLPPQAKPIELQMDSRNPASSTRNPLLDSLSDGTTPFNDSLRNVKPDQGGYGARLQGAKTLEQQQELQRYIFDQYDQGRISGKDYEDYLSRLQERMDPGVSNKDTQEQWDESNTWKRQQQQLQRGGR